jgi:hypothetical protein
MCFNAVLNNIQKRMYTITVTVNNELEHILPLKTGGGLLNKEVNDCIWLNKIKPLKFMHTNKNPIHYEFIVLSSFDMY